MELIRVFIHGIGMVDAELLFRYPDGDKLVRYQGKAYLISIRPKG